MFINDVSDVIIIKLTNGIQADFKLFLFKKLIEWCHFVAYSWNDPRGLVYRRLCTGHICIIHSYQDSPECTKVTYCKTHNDTMYNLMYVYTVRSSRRTVAQPIAATIACTFTRCDRHGDRSHDRSPLRSPRV